MDATPILWLEALSIKTLSVPHVAGISTKVQLNVTSQYVKQDRPNPSQAKLLYKEQPLRNLWTLETDLQFLDGLQPLTNKSQAEW
jgi:hypothetical protein